MLNLNKKTEFDHLNYQELSTLCKSCTNCQLAETRTNVVVGNGPVPCNVMVIGEGPGEAEDLSGLPFVGKAGKVLTKLFESVAINRDTDVYIANTVKCRPPKNRTPLPSEINACKPYLIRQIQLVKPKILILLGSPSLKTILEEPLAITTIRGKWFEAKIGYMDQPLMIMPLFHPSYLLRNPSQEKGRPKWLTEQDIKEIKRVMDCYKS